MKFADLIALVVAVLGLAGALEGFLKVQFSTTLIALAVIGALIFFVTARRLAEWIKVKFKPGYNIGGSHRSGLKILFAILALGLIGFCFVSLGYWVIETYAVNIEDPIVTEGRGELWIRGSRQLANQIEVLLPLRSEFKCGPHSETTAQVGVVNLDKPDPSLKTTNFRDPQRLGISCRPPVTVDRFIFKVEPPTLEVLPPDRRLKLKKRFIYLGGALWILSGVFVIWQSRSR
jgi:hypothetical protein